jgi:phospholipid/cholesterol/gamma-HCH transport system substrate-binding protein
LSDSLKQLKVNETLLRTRQMIANLNDILLKMKKKDNTLGKMMNEDSLYVNLNVVLKRLDTLVSHIDNNPKQFFKLAKNKSKIQRERQEEAAKKKAAKK